MPESTSPTPLPPSGGENNNSNPSLDLSVVTLTSPRQVGLTRRQMESISLAIALLDVARKPDYADKLAEKGVGVAHLTFLEQDVARVLGFGRTAVNSGATGKDATVDGTLAQESLLLTLRAIQAAARLQHLPKHPRLLEKYYIGKDITASRAVLESISQNMIDQANEERPGSIDTGFITRAEADRKAYVSPANPNHSTTGTGKQARKLRDEAFLQLVSTRKKVQYAADILWPHGKSENEQARSDFRLPANRPYSY